MVETKGFLANPKLQYCVSQWEGYDCSAHNKKNGVYYECKEKLIMSAHWGGRYCSAHNKKNREYYEYPSLSHFTNEL